MDTLSAKDILGAGKFFPNLITTVKDLVFEISAHGQVGKIAARMA